MGDINLHIATIVIAAIVWLWYSFSRARELAIKRASLACKSQELQLLDQSINLRTFSIRKNASGDYCFLRGYHFDFSLDGYDRYPAFIIMIGKNIERIQFDHPDGRIIMNDKAIEQVH